MKRSSLSSGLFALALTMCVAGCGGEHHEAHHAGEGEHHHHEMTGPVGDFHKVIAPVWHSEKGAGRDAKACDQAKTMQERAAAIDAVPAPDHADPGAYAGATRVLIASIDALIAACAKGGRPEVDAKLTAVHDAFHKVMEEGAVKHHGPDNIE